MHLAYISHEYPPDTGKGGIGTYTKQMALAMSLLGHQVEVFAASLHRNESNFEDGVWVHRILFRSKDDFPLDIVPIFSERHQLKAFDLMECPEIGAEANAIHSLLPQIPLVVRLHTPSVLVVRLQNTYTPLSSKLRFVLGSILRLKLDLGFWSKHDKNQFSDPDFLITQKAALITAPSLAMKKWAVQFWRIDPERIKVIPNPYEPSTELLKIENSGEHQLITYFGRLNVLKGMVALTKAIPLVLKKHPDWKFRLIGNSEQSPVDGVNMKEWMLRKLKPYLNQIEFIDWINYDDIPFYLAKTDICVFPSLFESFSYVCVEAMSAGKAIVGSKYGGMNELLANNSGLAVDTKRASLIASSLNRLIENKDLRHTFGLNARLRVLNELKFANVASLMEIVYADVAADY